MTVEFRQGGDTELERGVLAELVQKLAETLKLLPWECVRLRKALVNAPRAWWAKVNEAVSSLEPCLWRPMSKERRILGFCCVHVDDFLLALDESKSETQHSTLQH